MPHSLLDLISERQAAVADAVTTLREQIGKLTDELHAAETELTDLATTRTTLTRLTATSDALTANGPPDTVYQQILAVFTTGNGGPMRAKDVCHALGLGTEPKDTEGIRAKLKRLVKRRHLTETEPGLFTFAPTTAAPADATAA